VSIGPDIHGEIESAAYNGGAAGFEFYAKRKIVDGEESRGAKQSTPEMANMIGDSGADAGAKKRSLNHRQPPAMQQRSLLENQGPEKELARAAIHNLGAAGPK